MADDSKTVEFVVSPVIKNFVYDLYQSIRRSHILPEIQKLYEVDYREINDKYFSNSPWPDTRSIASDCDNDEIFLCFYRYVICEDISCMSVHLLVVCLHSELTLRHLFMKLKPQLKDFFESWENYTKVREISIL
jgi:translation initiation factor 3 subunit L